MNHPLSASFRIACAIAALLLTAAAPAPGSPAASQRTTPGGELAPLPSDDISPAEERDMLDAIQRNIATLQRMGRLAAPDAAQTVKYAFPLRVAQGLPDYAGFTVSAFVDHNPASGQVMDYNGGSRTYDGHKGTDYGLWPFPWNKLDGNEMQVVAAAAGTIVAYANVNPSDHNCGPASTGNWNYVALSHADGRMTIYGHMRYNSLTSKGIGQTVAQGELLGIAASSGNSSGPHLHFEVRAASFSPDVIDPYAGPASQAESFWANQRPYIDSGINRLATHSAPPGTPDPCKPSLTNFQDSFSAPSTVYLYPYFRDYQGGLNTQFTLYRPDGTILQSWQDAPAAGTFFAAASRARAIAFPANAPAGTWRYEAAYNGQTYTTYFNVSAPPTITLNSPIGGEGWGRAAAHAVTWKDNFGGDVNIALYHNGVYSGSLAYNTPSDGEFQWTPGAALAAGSGYTVRVASVINPAVFADSGAPFTLTDTDINTGTITNTHLSAQADFVMTPMAVPVAIDVLGNDGKPVSEAITLTALGQPLSGTASLSGTLVVYTPALDFIGTDSFTYTVRTSAESADAAVTVRVAAAIARTLLPLVRR